MRNKIGLVLVILVGAFLSFYGVLLSLFGDATQTEQLQFIALILLVYFVIGGLTGFFLPRYRWMGGLILAVPGVFILFSFLVTAINQYILLYLALLLSASCGGAWLGSRWSERRHNKTK